MLDFHFKAIHTETERELLVVSNLADGFFLTSLNSNLVNFEQSKNIEHLKNNKVYRHYKNVNYRTLFDAKNIDNNEQFVVYTNDEYEAKGIYWARPYDMFHGNQTLEDGTEVKRFTLID